MIHCRTNKIDAAVQSSNHPAAAAGIAVVCVATVLIVIGIFAVFRHPDRRQVITLLFTLLFGCPVGHITYIARPSICSSVLLSRPWKQKKT